MTGDDTDSVIPVTGVGSTTIIGGVLCCVGLKLLGGAALFGGLAAAVGVSTGLVTFLVGGVGGLLLAVSAVWYRRFGTRST